MSSCNTINTLAKSISALDAVHRTSGICEANSVRDGRNDIIYTARNPDERKIMSTQPAVITERDIASAVELIAAEEGDSDDADNDDEGIQ